MSQESRWRREARRRQTARPPRWVPVNGSADVHAEIGGLLETAAMLAAAVPSGLGPYVAQLNDLGAAAPDASGDPCRVLLDEVSTRLAWAWENGWQPLDLVHATRRHTSKAVARWMVRAVLLDAVRSDARARAPQQWVDQLDVLTPRRRADADEELLQAGGRADLVEWTTALVGVGLLQKLPAAPLLLPPPSRWDVQRAAAPQHAPAVEQNEKRARMLTKVRALLAKAESTEFVGEAETLTAKAQDLMTRYSIDESLLADELGPDVDVRGVRVLVHHPYASEKVGLLTVVGRANRVRTVWSTFSSCATLVGLPVDVEQVEMLFTSTLVQATRAMTQAGDRPGGGDRSSAFRKAFLTAYAHRIGERLAESAEETAATYGAQLVPALQRQEAAIDGEFARLFPDVTTGSRQVSFDARGWDAGTRAADAAVLPAGAVES
jgi:hypothetical protein